MATWSYQVKYVYDDDLPSGNFVTPVDISSNVITIENMTDVGTGEVNTAVLMLNARDGQFITEDNSGATPQINQFDRIYIKITDTNGAIYDKVYEVESLQQQKTIKDGIRLVVNLMGLERHLQQVHFAKQYFYTSGFDLVKDVIDRYNTSAGSKQVDVEKHDTVSSGGTYYNELPKWTANNMDFGVSETYCYDGVNDLVNKLGSSISAGGAGDFFEFTFKDDSTISNNKLFFHAFKSGENSNQSSVPVITNPTNTLPIYETNGELENETGSVIFAKGAKGYGSMPTNVSKFRSYKEEFDLIPAWQTGESYPSGARVVYNNVKYQANTTTSGTWTGSQWDQIKLGDLAGNINYSPYTSSLSEVTSGDGGNNGSDGYKLLLSSGSNPSDTTASHNAFSSDSGTTEFDWHGCWDSNLVIRDEDHFRTWVDCKCETNSNIPSELKMSGDVYRGFRVLVKGTVTGIFASYPNRVMQYDGSEWKQFYPFNNGTTPHDDAQVAVINEGMNYVYNKHTSNQWATEKGTGSTYDKSNDCFHVATNIFSEDGVSESLKSTGSTTSTIMYGENSATAFEYWFKVFDSLLGYFVTTAGYYQVGAWANFKVPYPTTSDQLPSGYTVGSEYVNPTIDVNNMHLTPDGNTGFNADDSEELGILETLSFFCKFKYFYNYIVTDDETLIPFKGKFRFRCTCYDTSDNVVTQDFEIAFNENWEFVSLPISAFKIYRARVTKRWGEVASNLIMPELEVTEVFQWKNLKMISIQCQESYDGVGRFAAEEGQLNNAWDNLNPIVTFTGGMRQKTRLSIDNLHFSKQLTATSGKDTSRNVTPIFMERPYTSNYKQLQSDAKAQLDIEKHRFESFEIETEGACPDNLRFGDSFYLVDDDVVYVPSSERTDAEAENKIKLVAKKIEYTINGTDGGRGGFIRRITGVKRFA